MRLLALGILIVCGLANAAEMYRCKAKDGSLVFSDQPCSPDAKKHEVKEAQSISAQPSVGVTVDEVNAGLTQRIEMDRISRQIKKKKNELDTLSEEMNRKVKALQNDMAYSKNNLAGATRDEALASQMNAITSQYDSRMRVVQSEITRLQSEYDRVSPVK